MIYILSKFVICCIIIFLVDIFFVNYNVSRNGGEVDKVGSKFKLVINFFFCMFVLSGFFFFFESYV